jgi:alcohol dehydrogenase YqhD (iron-dependent ADH family)
MKTKTFYLFGTDAVKEFQESQDSKAVAEIIRNNGGQLYIIGIYDNISNLLSAYDGWNDFLELSEEDFNFISDAI